MRKFLREFYNGESSLACKNSESVNGEVLHCDVTCIFSLSSVNQVYERINRRGNIRPSLSITEKNLPFRALIIYHPFSVPHLPLKFPVSAAGRPELFIQFSPSIAFYLKLVFNIYIYIYIYIYLYSNKISPCRHRIL